MEDKGDGVRQVKIKIQEENMEGSQKICLKRVPKNWEEEKRGERV